MKVIVEVVEVRAKKVQSTDCEYMIKLVTDNPQILTLARYINEKTIEIEIKDE